MKLNMKQFHQLCGYIVKVHDSKGRKADIGLLSRTVMIARRVPSVTFVHNNLLLAYVKGDHYEVSGKIVAEGLPSFIQFVCVCVCVCVFFSRLRGLLGKV